MALLHVVKGIEISCNFLYAKIIDLDKVQDEVTTLAQNKCLTIEQGYQTDYFEDHILQSTLQMLKLKEKYNL